LVDDELAPYHTDHREKITATGPYVNLLPAAAQTIALAVHELATNAAKYGALSSNTGKVKVSWELGPSGLRLQWLESEGPPVKAPSAVGYGTRVVTASVENQLGGEAVFDWRPQGLCCVISIPRDEETKPLEHGQKRADVANKAEIPDKVGDASSEQRRLGKRMLIAEDEALVAIMMEDIALELGWSVVGPFAKTADALLAAKTDDIDAAILDVSLAGEAVYPVAEMLVARGVPFVFTTGYGTESIDRRFARIPVLQKPIDLEALRQAFLSESAGRIDSEASSPVSTADFCKSTTNLTPREQRSRSAAVAKPIRILGNS
jgi:CheY-like chemotaxis protein